MNVLFNSLNPNSAIHCTITFKFSVDLLFSRRLSSGLFSNIFQTLLTNQQWRPLRPSSTRNASSVLLPLMHVACLNMRRNASLVCKITSQPLPRKSIRYWTLKASLSSRPIQPVGIVLIYVSRPLNPESCKSWQSAQLATPL